MGEELRLRNEPQTLCCPHCDLDDDMLIKDTTQTPDEVRIGLWCVYCKKPSTIILKRLEEHMTLYMVTKKQKNQG